jgi:hypothetical protein
LTELPTTQANVDPFSRLLPYRHNVWKYYGLVALASDGYPLARAPLDHAKIVAHPIHGAYFITEYLNAYQFGGRKDRSYLRYAAELARAAVSRMEEENGCLKFFYEPSELVTPYSYRFYSGLTQAKYLEAFTRLFRETGDAWVSQTNDKIFRSFLVAVEEGGVLLNTRHGTFLEEYPTEVPGFVLNGWLTTINEIFSYAITSKNKNALALAKKNARTLLAIIHLYDVKEMLNTRYKLSGSVLNALVFSNENVSINTVTIKTSGLELVKRVGDSRRYDTLHTVKLPGNGERLFVFWAMLSMIEYPDASELKVQVSSAVAQTVRWSLGVPTFDPRFATPRASGQKFMRQFELAPGENTISLQIPWDIAAGWVGPVPFSKRIAERYYNAYHYIHIKGLSQLYEFYPAARLLYWRDRWLEYTEKWSTFPAYAVEGICHEVMDFGNFSSQAAYLRAPKFRLIDGELVTFYSADEAKGETSVEAVARQ